MLSGKLDRRVTFQLKTVASDAYGSGTSVSWADAFTTFAQVVELKGKESFDASQKVTNADVKLRIRYRTDINTNSYRFVFGVNTYDLFSIQELGRQDGLEVFGNLFNQT